MAGSAWLQGLLTTAIMVGPGRQIYGVGLRALWRRAPEMNALVALGTLAAWGYSVAALVGAVPITEVYFEAAAVIVAFILAGRALEARAKGRAGAAIARLHALAPDKAIQLKGDSQATVRVEDIRVGDILLARAGERIAVDGTVLDGAPFVDEAMLTGEPAPVSKSPGDAVAAGTVNGATAFRYRAEAVGADTVLARIARMVEEAQGTKLPIQALVDRVTGVFVPAIIAIAIVTFCIWLLLGASVGSALSYGIAVLVVACPCAMGLATPASILAGTGRAAEFGILFRGGDALQRLAEAGVVAFDKTGTLTVGRPTVTQVDLVAGAEREAVLSAAAAVEGGSDHPLAAAIRATMPEAGLAADITVQPGLGVSGIVDGQTIRVGSWHFVAETEAATDPFTQLEGVETEVFVSIDGKVAARIAIADPIKPGAAPAVAALHQDGVATALITGDARRTGEAVAAALGIDHVVAGARPDTKLAALQDLRAEHGLAAFVGDGINDAPALAEADIGIAIGTGTDVAIEAADVILAQGDPRSVHQARELSAATLRNIKQNLGWAFVYNAALIPVAAGVFAFAGVQLSPMLAGAAMALSSICVLGNALRLAHFGGRLRMPPEPSVTAPIPAQSVTST